MINLSSFSHAAFMLKSKAHELASSAFIVDQYVSDTRLPGFGDYDLLKAAEDCEETAATFRRLHARIEQKRADAANQSPVAAE